MTTKRWQLAHGRHLDLGGKALVMGILNVTPDSFSDGGRFVDVEQRARAGAAHGRRGRGDHRCRRRIRRGRAPSRSPPRKSRRACCRSSRRWPPSGDALISVDTYREETARLAVAAGAHIVNDVWGLQREPGIARVAAETGAGLVIMHTGREREKLPDVIADQFVFLERSLEIAAAARRRRRPDRARSGLRLRQGRRRRTSS